ncbi:MAG: xanthine dehydrogenase family protein subunit M [Chloroflexi bacterium]|nr:xanthine dehydrogenase family protein subunit M [Chloroflexota bacterium]
MKPFAYARASSVAEAIEVLDDRCRPLAGGTDLVALMKAGLAAPERLVSIKWIPGLREIKVRAEGLHIGAMATLSSLAAHPSVKEPRERAVLYESLVQTASPQLRHMATVAGNLLQQPRCWYYRNPLTPCWRKSGRMCFAYRGENKRHVLFGGGPCYAVHPSDPAVALLALGARVMLIGRQGERTLPLEEFYRRPDKESRQAVAIAPDELITEIFVPTPAEGSAGTYVKVANRAAWDFAQVSVAAQLVIEEGLVRQARVALGGVATLPWRATEVEGTLEGCPLRAETIEKAARAAIAGARPLAQNAYKVELLQGALREALNKLCSL